jgi:amino acid adenylation domain-containing protein/thioester reductase-like protein
MENNVTENVLTAGAFGYLLSLYAMSKKTSFATVYNGRHDMKTARTVTMLVKTLPVLCDTDPALTVALYLFKLKERMMGAMVNDIYSFRELASKTGYNSDVLFTYQGDLFEMPKRGGLGAVLEELPFNATGEKLSIQLYPLNGRLVLDIQYHGNLYSEKWICDFAERYGRVLTGFMSEKMLKNVQIVTPGEAEAIIKASYGGDLPYDGEKTYVKMLAGQVKKHPVKRAVIDKNGEYTYKQLDDISNIIANRLVKDGVGLRDFVAIKTGRVKEFVAAVAGVQKAGAAYIPVDPAYPEERISYMLEDSGAKVVLTEEKIKEILSDKPDKTPVDRADPDSPAYMIYTSGSTGKPKGVVILNRSLTAAIEWRLPLYNLTENSKNVSHPSFSFDASVDDLFPPLASGGELHILSEEQRMDLDVIYGYICKNNITGCTMSTQIGMSLINAHPDLKLDYMVVGGEKLLPFAKTGIKVYNGYGPTEFTVCSSVHLVDQEKDEDIPIGRAVPNSYSFICDQNGNLLPSGMVGELCLAGVQASEGYYNRPELNKERFIDCKYAPNLKTFRTGDLAKYNGQGELEYCGRIDFQVKLRGFRIELGEIENRAAQFDGVDKSIALVKNKQLVLYYTAADRVKESELKAYMAANLTDYMVPSVFMRLDEMPLNPSGKIDRKALPEPVRLAADAVPPANEDEKTVFDILCKVLGYNDFGVTDDFKQTGLTSLSAMQFTAALSFALGKPVRMSEIGQHPTVRELALFLSEKAEEKTYEKRAEYPLTKLQEGVFVECTTHPGTTVYNIPVLLKLDPSVDLDRLEKALTAAINAHPYLKMRIKSSDTGDVAAARDDGREIKIKRYDIGEIKGGLQALVRPFELLKDDLFRAALIEDKADKYMFTDGHHMVFDGESLTVFMRDLDTAYNGGAVEVEKYTGFEVALDEAERLKTDAYGRAKAYYEELVGAADTECVPVRDKDDGEEKGASFKVDAPVNEAELNGFLKSSGATVNALWNTAFGFALAKFLSREDSVFTTVYNGRGDARLLNSVGMYVHTLPVVFRNIGGEKGKDTVRRVAKQLTDSMDNDIYPFSEISRTLGVKANILFVYEGKIGAEMTVGGKPAEQVKTSLDALKADLTVYVFEADGGYSIYTEYNARYYEEWSVRSLIESAAKAFTALVRGGETDKISLLSNEEADKIDKETFEYHDVEKTDIVTLFRRAAKEYPDNTAVIFKDRKLTYRELDGLTDKVAAYLQKRGAGVNDIVSVLVNRSEYMVISALGALKSGAAYEPLDPGYPPKRLNFMVGNAKAKYVIADKELIGLLSEYKGETLFTKDITALPDEKPADPEHKSGDLFIVLYTSGTTGTPKGVMLEHGNLVNFCAWYRSNYDLKPSSVVGAYASFGFDADMMDLYPALTTGAAVYIIPEDMRLELNTLDGELYKNKVSHLFMTTQMGRMFAENMKGESLSHLSVGGESLAPVDPPAGFFLWNGYGPTECTIFSTARRIDKKFYRNPIGKALWNYRLYVVDKNGKRLPKGALGELWIAGAGVGRGYLDLPEKTKQAFIENPFDKTPGFERAYRTGDIVRRLGDGEIDFIGRNDGQVKVRGFRIELGEVESVIREYDGIKNVTIQAFDDTAFGGKFLAAYVVSDKKVDFEALSEFIKSKKPAYMVPAAFMQLDAIPLNQNQKVNRRALPAPVRTAGKTEKNEPETELEREICKVYAGILGLERVGATDNFFSLGGTSISAAKVVMFAMNKNYPVVYKDVFENPTPRQLAARITEQSGVTAEKTEQTEETNEEALKYNASRYVNDIAKTRPLGRTLLTGATGFLGSHLLKELMNNGADTLVLCRGTNELDAKTRLSALMAYYFDEPADESDTLKVIDGDITNENLLELLKDERIDTIINSAACVKHFAADDTIERINVGGVKNLIEVAKAHSARLIQISTLSVAGENVDGKFPPNFRLAENQLFVGQDVSNKYVNSKFNAEKAVIEAMGEGLDAKMIRVGNLMGRQSDGEFQINSITNNFIKSLRAYQTLGYFPVSSADATVDFSPVDEVARAVVLLSQTDKRFTAFHAANAHEVQMGDVIEEMNKNGFKIETVPDDVFADKMNEFLRDGEKNMLVSTLLTYASSDRRVHTFIKTDNNFTIKALYRLGFKWPITDAQYLNRIIEGLKSLRFFERDDI